MMTPRIRSFEPEIFSHERLIENDDSCVLNMSRACPRRRDSERKKKEKKEKKPIVALQTRPAIGDPQIENVFEHWKVLMDHPNAKLDEKRKTIIRKALKFGYSVSDLCQAIAGCSYTPHNIGDNERGQRYDGLQVILRDPYQIDRFIHNCKFPPGRQTDADRCIYANYFCGVFEHENAKNGFECAAPMLIGDANKAVEDIHDGEERLLGIQTLSQSIHEIMRQLPSSRTNGNKEDE